MHIDKLLNEIGIVNEVIGDNNFTTMGLAVAKCEGDLCTFVESEKYLSGMAKNVAMVITNREVANNAKREYSFCIVENPRNTFFKLHNHLSENPEYARPKDKSRIGKSCKISKLSSIAELGVIIGDNVIIEEFVSIKENTVIGDNVIIRAGSIIGGEGFEFKRENNSIFPVKHLGGVVIENNVEIQQSTCVDKAIYPWDNTVIGEYSKVDNLVHIAHGVKIGRGAMIVAGSMIGGRVEIGDGAWIGLGSMLRNGINVGKSSRANMGAVVSKSIEDGEAVTGNFAIKHSKFIEKLKVLAMEEK